MSLRTATSLRLDAYDRDHHPPGRDVPQSQNRTFLERGWPEDENEALPDRPRANQPRAFPLLALRPLIHSAIRVTPIIPFQHYLRPLFQSGQTDERDHLRPDRMFLHPPLYNTPSHPSPVTVAERTTSNITYTRHAQVVRKGTSTCVYNVTARDVAVFDGVVLMPPHTRPFNESYRRLLDALYK